MGPHAWLLPIVVTLGLLSSLLEGVGLGLMIPFLHLIIDGESSASAGGAVVARLLQYGAELDRSVRLLLIGGTIVGLILLKAIVSFASVTLSAWLNGQITTRLRLEAFDQLLKVSYAFIRDQDVGRLTAILDGETRRASQAITVVSQLIVSLCAVAVFTALLALISWQLTASVGICVLLGSLLTQRFSSRARRYGRKVVQLNQELSERLVEALGGMRMVRIFAQEHRERARFATIADNVRSVSVTNEMLSGSILPVMEVVYLPLFIFATIAASYWGVGLPTLFTCLLLLYRLQPHVKRADQSRVQLGTLIGAFEAISLLLRSDDKPYTQSGTIPFDSLREGIELNSVTFHYGDKPEQPAVYGLSFRISAGAVTAVVGGSGAGKSTLVNLLCRLYDPTEGEIRIDGLDLRKLDLVSWRRRVAVAGQDAELLSGTIRDNIAYGRPSASEGEIEQAAHSAGASEFIAALPHGYDTHIGGRGLKLSGGQRQRIALARALLCNPDVLILDEATNALDSLSETAFQETLAALRGRVTLLVIAHRMSTVRSADQVIVLRHGRVIERGRPSDLFKAKGVFAQMVELQTGTSA